MEVYDEMADYYDLIYGDQVDIEFYVREAKNARGPVLEVGCGNGRVLLRLLEAGIDATGIDLSKNLLDALKKRAAAMGLKPDVHLADMRDFTLGRKFKLVIIPYRAFLHLTSEADRRKALLRLREHLADKGRLVIHGYNPSQEELRMTEGFQLLESEELKDTQGTPYRLDWHLRYEPKAKVAHYRIILAINGRERTFAMDIAYVPVEEMRRLLKECGYGYVKAYCGFDYGQFYDDCREVLWIAEK